MLYFSSEMSKEEAKKVFRKLAVELHPDKPGGSHLAFLKMQTQYESFLKGNFAYTTKEAKDESTTLKNFFEANEFVATLDGCTVELTGSWVWICGNTFAHKDIIKANGFKYSRSKKKWYKAPYEITKKKRGVSFTKIQNKYGYESKKINVNTNNRLA